MDTVIVGSEEGREGITSIIIDSCKVVIRLVQWSIELVD